MNELTIKKVKVIPKQSKIKIDYLLNGDEMSGTFTERAEPEFYECLKKLGVSVCEMLELDPTAFLSRVTPYGVTYTHGGDVLRASIQAQLSMLESETETVINTPTRKVSTEYEDGLELATCQTLMELEEEAKRYLNGQRAQLNLFAADTQETDSEINVTPAPPALAAGE